VTEPAPAAEASPDGRRARLPAAVAAVREAPPWTGVAIVLGLMVAGLAVTQEVFSATPT
jgi:hypothetical protein